MGNDVSSFSTEIFRVPLTLPAAATTRQRQGDGFSGHVALILFMKTLTKKEAIELLGISPKTLQRRMASGQYKFTRNGEGQYAEVTFTYADLGLPEPAEPAPIAPVVESVTAPEPEPAPTSEPEPVPQRPLSNVDLRMIEDQIFADHYKQGLVTDSSGNTINGTNEKYPNVGPVTLLGPREPQQKPKASGTVHMDPRLVADPNVPCNPIDSDDYMELRQPGHKARMEQMYANAGVRRPTETEQKQVVDRAAVMAAIRQGFAR